ncbi:HNH endonuclease signature motif containing protein [Sulfitobacter sp. AS92]|uniref:HNH endonuclease signature motif containing protein n=1 Tax=Sulfitobacter sp. AS92 TaxID=3135783 RepID=UPI0031796965
MKGRAIAYTQKELDWIKARCDQPRKDLHAAFQKRFDRNDVTVDSIKALCTRKGWKSGRTGQFVKGQAPMNKGKKMPFNANSARTQFKKGQLPHNHKGLGHERICPKDGYVTMIVAERNPWTGAATRPVLKHRWLWEKINGPVPDGHFLKCLDGDKTNCDPANWELLPQAILPRLAGGRHGKGYAEYEPELRPTVLAIAKLEHQVRESKNAQPLRPTVE